MTDPPLCVDSGLLVTRVKAALSPHLTPSRVWGEALCGGVACSQNTRANLRRARGWCCVLAYGPRCRRGARPRLEVSQFIPIEATPALPHPAGQRPSDTGPAEWGPLCHADTRRQPPSPSWTCPHTRKHCLSLPGVLTPGQGHLTKQELRRNLSAEKPGSGALLTSRPGHRRVAGPEGADATQTEPHCPTGAHGLQVARQPLRTRAG